MEIRTHRLAATLVASILSGTAWAQTPEVPRAAAPVTVSAANSSYAGAQGAPTQLPAPNPSAASTAVGDVACGPNGTRGPGGLGSRSSCGREPLFHHYHNGHGWPCIGPNPMDVPPFGASLYEHFRQHVENAAAIRMMLYDFDFEAGSDALNLRGKDRLVQIAALSQNVSFPIVIERMPTTPGLAEARRTTVLRALAQLAVPLPPERVVIGPMMVRPLDGREAEIIYLNLLEQTYKRGQIPLYPTSGSSIGGSSGSGGGFGSSSGQR